MGFRVALLFSCVNIVFCFVARSKNKVNISGFRSNHLFAVNQKLVQQLQLEIEASDTRQADIEQQIQTYEVAINERRQYLASLAEDVKSKQERLQKAQAGQISGSFNLGTESFWPFPVAIFAAGRVLMERREAVAAERERRREEERLRVEDQERQDLAEKERLKKNVAAPIVAGFLCLVLIGNVLSSPQEPVDESLPQNDIVILVGEEEPPKLPKEEDITILEKSPKSEEVTVSEVGGRETIEEQKADVPVAQASKSDSKEEGSQFPAQSIDIEDNGDMSSDQDVEINNANPAFSPNLLGLPSFQFPKLGSAGTMSSKLAIPELPKVPDMSGISFNVPLRSNVEGKMGSSLDFSPVIANIDPLLLAAGGVVITLAGILVSVLGEDRTQSETANTSKAALEPKEVVEEEKQKTVEELQTDSDSEKVEEAGRIEMERQQAEEAARVEIERQKVEESRRVEAELRKMEEIAQAKEAEKREQTEEERAEAKQKEAALLAFKAEQTARALLTTRLENEQKSRFPGQQDSSNSKNMPKLMQDDIGIFRDGVGNTSDDEDDDDITPPSRLRSSPRGFG